MGVTTNLINKPLNPRAQDQSPLAYNRAALYSGKALSFDGVNDVVTGTASVLPTGANAFTTCFYLNKDADGEVVFWGTRSVNQSNGVGLFSGNKVVHFFYGNDLNSNSNIETGKWYFVAVTFDGTTRSIYINGQLDISDTPTGVNVTGTNYSLGYGGAYYHNGELSNVKVFNTALTAAQIADLYNFPEKIVPTGVDNTALKLWLPMMEGAGTTAYNGAADALGTEEVTNGDFATDSDWTKATGWTISGGKANANTAGNFVNIYQLGVFTIGKTYSYSFTITDYTQGSVRFTEAGNDISGQKTSVGVYTGIFTAIATSLYMQGLNDFVGSIDNVSVKELTDFGTISGATWTNGIGAPVAQTAVINWNKVSDGTNSVLIPQGLTTGRDLLGNLFENVRKQGALNLDGNSWAEVHDNASVDLTNGVSVEAWVKWDTSGVTDRGILGKWSSSVGYMLYKSLPSRVNFFINGSFSIYINLTDGWQHIVGTFDGANRKIYINGALEITDADTSTISTNSLPVEIGRFATVEGAVIDQPIAQPRIYNRALSAEEIQRNFNAGKNIYS